MSSEKMGIKGRGEKKNAGWKEFRDDTMKERHH